MSMRMDYLGGQMTRLLDRKTPPRNLIEGRAREDEIAALLRALDRVAPASGYEAWWPRFSDALDAGLKTRAWPTVGEIQAAAAEIREREAAVPPGGDEPPHIYEMVRDWWIKFRQPGPGRTLPKPHHAERLVGEGVATYGELFRRDFPLPRHREAEANSESDPQHEAILADIRAWGSRLRASGAPRGNAAGPFAGGTAHE